PSNFFGASGAVSRAAGTGDCGTKEGAALFTARFCGLAGTLVSRIGAASRTGKVSRTGAALSGVGAENAPAAAALAISRFAGIAGAAEAAVRDAVPRPGPPPNS